jgi:hypothetical protein
MIEIFSEHSVLHFNGNRNYIHGPTLFDVLCRALQKATDDFKATILVNKFSVNTTITDDGIIRVFKLSNLKIGGDGKRAFAEMICTLNAQSYYVGFFNAGPKLVSARINSIEKNYITEAKSETPFEGMCCLSGIASPLILIQALVEANKQIVLLSLPKPIKEKPYKFKFVYCLSYERWSKVPESSGQVFIENLGTRIYNDYCYILNSIRFEINQHSIKFPICFGSKDIAGIIT